MYPLTNTTIAAALPVVLGEVITRSTSPVEALSYSGSSVVGPVMLALMLLVIGALLVRASWRRTP